jgi:hypothetical protein
MGFEKILTRLKRQRINRWTTVPVRASGWPAGCRVARLKPRDLLVFVRPCTCNGVPGACASDLAAAIGLVGDHVTVRVLVVDFSTVCTCSQPSPVRCEGDRDRRTGAGAATVCVAV